MGERTPDVSTGPAWLRLGALIELIDELREAGYPVGVSQYVAAQDLILALIARGENLEHPLASRNPRGPKPRLWSANSKRSDGSRGAGGG
jgi:hypothetical protein